MALYACHPQEDNSDTKRIRIKDVDVNSKGPSKGYYSQNLAW